MMLTVSEGPRGKFDISSWWAVREQRGWEKIRYTVWHWGTLWEGHWWSGVRSRKSHWAIIWWWLDGAMLHWWSCLHWWYAAQSRYECWLNLLSLIVIHHNNLFISKQRNMFLSVMSGREMSEDLFLVFWLSQKNLVEDGRWSGCICICMCECV